MHKNIDIGWRWIFGMDCSHGLCQQRVPSDGRSEQFTINQLAAKVEQAANLLGFSIKIQHLHNPRKEAEKHYYNAINTSFFELGLKPHYLSANELSIMLKKISEFKDSIDTKKIMPRFSWNVDGPSPECHRDLVYAKKNQSMCANY